MERFTEWDYMRGCVEGIPSYLERLIDKYEKFIIESPECEDFLRLCIDTFKKMIDSYNEIFNE